MATENIFATQRKPLITMTSTVSRRWEIEPETKQKLVITEGECVVDFPATSLNDVSPEAMIGELIGIPAPGTYKRDASEVAALGEGRYRFRFVDQEKK